MHTYFCMHALHLSQRHGRQRKAGSISLQSASSIVARSLLVCPCGRPLLDECRHSFLLVLEGEHGVEDASFEANSLRQSHLVGSVNGFLCHGHGGLRERGDLVSHLESGIQQLILGHNSAHETVSLGLLGVNHIAGENHLHGLGLPHGADQSLGTSAAWDDAKGDLRLSELGTVSSDDDIAHHSELTTSAESVSGDSGDGRLANFGHFGPVSKHIIGVTVNKFTLSHLFDICAGCESLLASSDDDGTNISIVIEGTARMSDISKKRSAKSIESLRSI
mmetsp:Transcript_91842/g.198512  ORF Transcript_91842/g.198512 Transcript_91842/m.198512 type:complete len:277 (-) Transcript_91842:181-1011(-)